jgi:hypothetical protein
MQQNTQRPVQSEITEQTRNAILAWIQYAHLASNEFLFPSRISTSPHLSTRQYARIVDAWIESIGVDSTAYGTHTMRRTKATLIYRRTKNLRAVQLLLGHTKPKVISGNCRTKRPDARSSRAMTLRASATPCPSIAACKTSSFMLAAPLMLPLFVSAALDPNQFSRTNLCHTFRVRAVSVGICRVVLGAGSYGGNYRWNGATFRARIKRSAWSAHFG